MLLAMPNMAMVLASWGNNKNVRHIVTNLEHLLHLCAVAPIVVQVSRVISGACGSAEREAQIMAANCLLMYDKYIERFDSLISRGLAGAAVQRQKRLHLLTAGVKLKDEDGRRRASSL